jgi:hypothetical protein
MSANTVWQRLLSFFPEVVKGNSGAAPAVDWTAGSVQSITLNAATVTPTFTAPPGGANLALVVTQDGVGGRAVTWPAAVKWIGGTAPILLSGAAQTTLVYFYFDGTNYWGSLASGASPSSIIPWTAVAAGTALAASLAKPNLAADSSGAQSTITLPTAAAMAASDGFEFTIKATGNMLSPVIVTAGAGSTIELLNAPGTFGASTWLPIQGQGVVFKYDLATTTWKARASTEGSGAVGASAYNPGWYAAGTLFVDPQNTSGAASDAKTGRTAGAPLLTYAEVARRWGSTAPTLSVDTQIKFLSSHTDNSDPVSWSPMMLKGAIPSIIGTIATTAAVFTRSAAKNRAAGANSALAGSFSAGAPAAGVLVHNTTAAKDSRAFLYKTAGGANWTVCQPLVTQTIPQAALPAELDMWATNDTVELLALTAVNLIDFSPLIVDYNGAFDDLGYLQAITVFDPGGLNLSPVYIGTNVYCADVAFQRAIYANSTSASILTAQSWGPPVFANCFFGGGLNWLGVSAAILYGGCWPANGGTALRLVGHAAQPANTDVNLTIDGDFITGGAAFFSNVQIGFLFLDGNLTCTGTVIFDTAAAGGHVVYGTAGKTVSLRTCCRGLMNGTFTAGWTAPTLVTGVTIDGATTANSIAYAGAVGTIHNAITTSVANLDAAAGAAGFGGNAFNLGGSSVSNLVG